MTDDIKPIPLDVVIRESMQMKFADAMTRRYCKELNFACRFSPADGNLEKAVFSYETPYFIERLKMAHDGEGWGLTIRGDQLVRPNKIRIDSGGRLDHFIKGIQEAATLQVRLNGEIQKFKRI